MTYPNFSQDEFPQVDTPTTSSLPAPYKDDTLSLSNKSSEMEDDTHFWLLGGGIGLGIVACTALVILAIFLLCYRQKKLKQSGDKASLFVRKPIQTLRYSSSDTGDSPPATSSPPSFEGQFRNCLSPQSMHRSSSTSTYSYHPNLLAVIPSDQNGTSDEEDAQSMNSSGKIWFSHNYDKNIHSLSVHLVKVRYLRGRGLTHELRDPFVRLYLLPDEMNYQQSQIRKRTLSPKFNETFLFKVSPEDLPKRTLRLSVYDVDGRNVRHSLGHALVPLSKVDNSSLQTVIWKNLDIISQKMLQLGEVQFSLWCNPYAEKIRITLMQAKNLLFKEFDREKAELCFKVELLYGRKLMKTKMTPHQKVCENVDIYHKFTFCIASRHFDSTSLVVTLVLKKRFESSFEEAYGRVIVGPFMYARGEQLQHWQDMVTNPRVSVERWHNFSEVTEL